MEYIKHSGQFFKKIELKDLDKKELIVLITEAIEVEPRIVERWHSYPWYGSYINAIGITTPSTINYNSVTMADTLNKLDTPQLMTMCSTL